MYQHIKHILDSTLGYNVVLEVPKDSKNGHFATPIAFSLAKQLKRPPQQIAEEFKSKLQSFSEFASISVDNGYINFILSDTFLANISKKILTNTELFLKAPKNPSILIEFVSANPTGPLHIGHARGAIYGDTLARVGRALGYNITKEYYINDAGSQIDMLGLSVYLAGREILNKNGKNLTIKYPEEYYRGDYILDLALKVKDKFGDEVFLTDCPSSELVSFCVKEMLELIKQNLANANIKFDNFVSEKVLSSELESTLSTLKKNNALYEQDSKLWLKSSLKGDEKDRVVIRDTKEPTYLAGDIVYHNNKFKRDFDRYINIWGADHHGYIARIKASIDFLGYDSTKLEVILSQMVSLLKGGVPYKMSKRAGNFILMQDVVDEIGIDALRFVFLSKRADTHLEFDIDVFSKEDSNNPVYYINYANARIHTIFAKSNADCSFDFEKLDSKWKDLLVYAMLLPKILDSAFSERAMQKLPEYLKILASKFHFCYNSYRVIGSECEGEILSVLKMISLSITSGLELMGIVAKTKM